MQINCPHCNTQINLEAAADDACARQLLALLATQGAAAAALVAYLGLFKPRVQPLRWSRALALANEVCELMREDMPIVASAALSKTLEAFREKRQEPNWKPLQNHRYFLQVLESARREVISTERTVITRAAGQSKTAQALQALQARKK